MRIRYPRTWSGGSKHNGNSDGALLMWPNPNNGSEVWISLEGIDTVIQTVTVDIHDLLGKRVNARMLPTQDGSLLTLLPLNGDLASGMYMVNIIAGDKVYTQRFVVQQ